SVESLTGNTQRECLGRTGLPATGTEQHRPCHKISAATGVSTASKSGIRHHRQGAVSRKAPYYELGGLDTEPFSDLFVFLPDTGPKGIKDLRLSIFITFYDNVIISCYVLVIGYYPILHSLSTSQIKTQTSRISVMMINRIFFTG